MLRQIIQIELDNMIAAIADKLSEINVPISEDELSAITTPYAQTLSALVEDHIFKARTKMTAESAQIQIDKERIKKECEEKLGLKDEAIGKERAEASKYKRQLEEEQKEKIRLMEWNQALVKIIQENGLKLPKVIPTHMCLQELSLTATTAVSPLQRTQLDTPGIVAGVMHNVPKVTGTQEVSLDIPAVTVNPTKTQQKQNSSFQKDAHAATIPCGMLRERRWKQGR